MQARAVDLLRAAPQPAARSGATDSARSGVETAEPKVRSRFDQELSRRTRAKDEPAKPESKKPEPAVKAKPRGEMDAKRVDDDSAADASADTQSTDADPAVREADEAPKAEKTKTKAAKKSDAKKDDREVDATAEAPVAADAAQVVTLPTADADAGDADDSAIDPDAAKGEQRLADADADAALDPDAVAAAQLVAQQSAAQTDASAADTDATNVPASGQVTAATAKSAGPQSTTVQPAATDDATAADAHHAHGLKAADPKADADATADAESAGAFQLPPDAEKAAAPAAGKKDDAATLTPTIQPTAPHDKPAAPAPLPQTTATQPTPMRDPAEHNVDKIVTSVRGELLTKGGTMDIRLDPPSLGQVQVQISVEDGVMSANIQTTNDEATRLLSHNLAQLKTQLESAGVTVDRIQVKQATPAEQSNSSNGQSADGDSRQQSAASQDQSARQEQQRREALQRMWARVAGNGDPLDLVA